MRLERTFCVLLTLCLVSYVSDRLQAGHGCCAHCGRAAACNKVCRLVCEEKKVDVICWGSKCEDFCIPGCSKLDCKYCEEVCQNCDQDADPEVCSKPKKFVWREWIPGCATVHTKTKLMKKVETKKIPSYKWVVEDLCAECEHKAQHAQVPSGTKLPPVPETNARMLAGTPYAADNAQQ
ncbi:MAG: hypothetical protein K1X74_21715 [Pirellulales bacterium]|nr:hypothetical protein [Pirellulales bacterium]